MKKFRCSSKPFNMCYERDDKGNEVYPKTINGSEYYLYDKHKIPIFIKNNDNDELYAKDNLSNQIYPKYWPFFAKNRNSEFYYAKDSDQNEFYAKYKGLDIYTYNINGEVLIAHSNTGRQLYPKDPGGNEYYLVNRENKPFYLKDENGQNYPAKSKKNESLFLEPPILNQNRVYEQKDFLRNKVYLIRPKVNNYRVSLDVFCCLISMTLPLVTVILLFF